MHVYAHNYAMYEKKGIFWQNKLTETEVGIMSQFQQQTVNFNSSYAFFLFRSDSRLKELFSKSSLMVIREEMQKNLPSELYGVKM